MKDLKFKLLKILYELPFDESICEADLLNPLKGDKDENLLNAQNALKQMIAQKYVSKLLDDTYRIAIPGITIYEAEHAARLKERESEERHQKERAEDRALSENNLKKAYRHDWFIALFGLIGGVASSLILWCFTGR